MDLKPSSIVIKNKISDFSVAIICLNSEKKLSGLLKSLEMFDDIIVVDNGSTDSSIDIARSHKAKVVSCLSKDFKELRYCAMKSSKKNWILFIDTDERIVSDDLYRLQNIFKNQPSSNLGFWLKRRNYYGEHESDYLRHGNHYPDYQLRLMRTDTKYTNTPHDEPDIDKSKTIYTDIDIYHFQNKEKLFSIFGLKHYKSFTHNYALTQIHHGYLHLLWNLVFSPFRFFIFPLTRGKGILDGYFGVLAALNMTLQMMSIYIFAIILKLKNKKIKIAIDAGSFSPENPVTGGIERMCDGIINSIGDVHTDKYEFHFYGYNGTSFSKQNIFFHKLPKKYFASIFLPLNILLDGNTIFVALSSFVPLILKYTSIKKVVFVYDFGFLKNPSLYLNPHRMWRQINDSIKCADLIITLSKIVKKQIKNLYPNTQAKIEVVYPGVNIPKNTISPAFNNFFLFVGNIRDSKNLEAVISLFNNIKLKGDKLIIIGKYEKKYFDKLSNNSNISASVVFIKNISDKLLFGYYAKAKSLINLSYEEGFGFPVWECLACGGKTLVNDLKIYDEHKFSNMLKISPVTPLLEIQKFLTQKNHKISGDYFSWRDFSKKVLQYIDAI